MKIAVLAHLKFPIGTPFAGGLERHTHALVTGLRGRGHEVTLFAAAGSDPALGAVEMCPPTGPVTGDPVRDAAIDAAEEDAYARMMGRVKAGGFDLVHANCLHSLPLRDSGEVGLPMVTVLHVPPFEPFASALRAGASRIGVVSVSRCLAEAWREVVAGSRVIGNGVDLQTFAPQHDEGGSVRSGSQATAPPAEPYAFWSGRLSPEKGLHLAMDAARMAGIELAFAGPRGDPAYWREEIEPRLGPGIRDLGHLKEDELVACLAGACVAVVSPRWEEPFGLVVIEALACGTPIAGFARGALPDLVDRATSRLAAADDVAGLARAMVEASRLDRAACRARAEAHFGISRMIDAYEALYRDVLAGTVSFGGAAGACFETALRASSA